MKTKKIATVFLALLCSAGSLFAQDLILLTNGDEINAKVEEVGIESIKYKKADNLDGPVYVIPKADVFLIKYAGGSKDVFGAKHDGQVDTPQPTPEPQQIAPEVTLAPVDAKWRPIRGYIGFSLGVAIPLGSFSGKGDFLANTNEPGFQLNIANFGLLFSDRIGVCASIFASNNVWKNGLNTYTWTNAGFMVGPLISLPLAYRLNFDVRPMIGYCETSIPILYDSHDALYYYSDYNYEINESWAFGAGVSLRFQAAKNLAITLNADYLYTEAFRYSNTKAYSDVDINMLTISAGMAFRIR